MRGPVNPARLEPPDGITPSTWRLALVLAEIALGHRRLKVTETPREEMDS